MGTLAYRRVFLLRRSRPVWSAALCRRYGGKGIITSGRNHQGDTDWTQVEVFFEAPPDGLARIVVFHVGFGKGTGTAWFDDLKLEAIDGADRPLGVTRTPLYPEKNCPRPTLRFQLLPPPGGTEGPGPSSDPPGSQEYAACEFRPEGGWKKFTARLSLSGDDPNATLSITFRGPGTLWLDSASLMPEKTVGGWRPDVVAAVRAVKPGIIRFGGSALDDPNLGSFDWRDTLGDPDRRRPFKAWGGLQPAGAGLEEFVQFCHHVGAEPLLCVRVTGKTPKDAADQVEYFNGPADSPR